MILRIPKNYDELHEETISKGIPIHYLNDFSYFDSYDREMLEYRLKDLVDGDNVSTVASCLCGAITAQYEEGNTCDKCGSIVKNRMKEFETDLWVKAPSEYGIDRWLNPVFIVRLHSSLHVDHRHLFRWFGDKENNPRIKGVPFSNLPVIEAIKEMDGFERSYNFFINHIPEIIKTIISVSTNSPSNKRLMSLLKYYSRFEDKLFSKYFPILSKRFMIVEKGVRGSHEFKESIEVGDIVLSLLSAFESGKKVETRTTNFLVKYAELKERIDETVIGSKHGMFKENILGMRTIFSTRPVLTAIVGKHKYDEVRLPWGPTVVMLKPYIFNKLRRKGFRYNDMMRKWYKAIHNRDSEIGEIIEELKKERGGYLPVALLRNPAQSNYGTLFLKAYVIKDNPEDTTVSASTKVLTYPNADIDGDEVMIKLLEDYWMEMKFSKFHPTNDVAGSMPGTIFGKVTLTKPVVAIIGNRIQEERKILGI